MRLKRMSLFYFVHKNCSYCRLRPNQINGFCYACLSSLHVELLMWKLDYTMTGYSIVKSNDLCLEILRRTKFSSSIRLWRFVIHELLNLLDHPLNFDSITWVPIPINKIRMRERGFNQSFILAEKLAETFGGRLCNAICRPKENESLTNFGREERSIRSEGIFEKTSNELLHNVVLVDDLITTGSTIKAGLSCFQKDELNIDFNFLTLFKGLGEDTGDFMLEQKEYMVRWV